MLFEIIEQYLEYLSRILLTTTMSLWKALTVPLIELVFAYRRPPAAWSWCFSDDLAQDGPYPCLVGSKCVNCGMSCNVYGCEKCVFNTGSHQEWLQ